jgi:hypothetical protein
MNVNYILYIDNYLLLLLILSSFRFIIETYSHFINPKKKGVYKKFLVEMIVNGLFERQ